LANPADNNCFWWALLQVFFPKNIVNKDDVLRTKMLELKAAVLHKAGQLIQERSNKDIRYRDEYSLVDLEEVNKMKIDDAWGGPDAMVIDAFEQLFHINVDVKGEGVAIHAEWNSRNRTAYQGPYEICNMGGNHWEMTIHGHPYEGLDPGEAIKQAYQLSLKDMRNPSRWTGPLPLKGDWVLYTDSSHQYYAKVMFVDYSISPPEYLVRIEDENEKQIDRSTVIERLQPLDLAQVAQAQQEAANNAARRWEAQWEVHEKQRVAQETAESAQSAPKASDAGDATQAAEEMRVQALAAAKAAFDAHLAAIEANAYADLLSKRNAERLAEAEAYSQMEARIAAEKAKVEAEAKEKAQAELAKAEARTKAEAEARDRDPRRLEDLSTLRVGLYLSSRPEKYKIGIDDLISNHYKLVSGPRDADSAFRALYNGITDEEEEWTVLATYWRSKEKVSSDSYPWLPSLFQYFALRKNANIVARIEGKWTLLAEPAGGTADTVVWLESVGGPHFDGYRFLPSAGAVQSTPPLQVSRDRILDAKMTIASMRNLAAQMRADSL
jgi:hypothetical protein